MVRMKSSAKRNAVAFTGNSCNGKSTIAELTEAALNSKHQKSPLFRIDMSEIISYGLKMETSLGDTVRACIPQMKKGEYVPDNVVRPLFFSWMDEELPQIEDRLGRSINLLIIAGMPRTHAQIDMMSIAFNRFQVINIITTYEQAYSRYLHRLAKMPPEKRRQDDAGGKAVFDNRWKVYEEQTLPALESLGNAVLHVSHAEALNPRLKRVFTFLRNNRTTSPVSANAANTALWRLNSRGHRINEAISCIEAPLPVNQMLATG